MIYYQACRPNTGRAYSTYIPLIILENNQPHVQIYFYEQPWPHEHLRLFTGIPRVWILHTVPVPVNTIPGPVLGPRLPPFAVWLRASFAGSSLNSFVTGAMGAKKCLDNKGEECMSDIVYVTNAMRSCEGLVCIH